MRLIAVLAIVATALPIASPVALAAKDACDTGWTSKRVAPPTIRVYRVLRDRVDTVDFRDYVAIVMASGEWPSYMPDEALKVGAVAVKQYAWYYLLSGNHRPSYVAPSGECYDVKDSTIDQLFKPERAEVRNNQLAAIDETWDLTLRKTKKNRFFLTGYRAGSNVKCGEDANGWKIFQKSLTDCAKKGMTRQEMQELYLSPNLTFVWANGNSNPEPNDPPKAGKAPTVDAPTPGVKVGGTLGNGTSVISWSGSDPDDDIVRYKLQHRVNGSTWSNVALPSKTATSVQLPLALGKDHQFRVKAFDAGDRASAWAVGPSFRPVLRQEKANAIGWSGDWTQATPAAASGAALRYSRTGSSSATFKFTGRTVAYIAPRRPTGGIIEVQIDDGPKKTIDLHASKAQHRQVLFARSWANAGQHTITVTRFDGRVDLDAFLLYR